MLKKALAEGMISPDEESMLEGFRERFGISLEQHEEMRGEFEQK